MHSAICPSCGTSNTLQDSDLGVRLNCGSCGQPFVFGEEILKARKEKKAEEDRLQRERLKAEAESRANARMLSQEAEARKRKAAEAERDAAEQRAKSEFEDELAAQVDAEVLTTKLHGRMGSAANLHRTSFMAVLMGLFGIGLLLMGGYNLINGWVIEANAQRAVSRGDTSGSERIGSGLAGVFGVQYATNVQILGAALLTAGFAAMTCAYAIECHAAIWQTHRRANVAARAQRNESGS